MPDATPAATPVAAAEAWFLRHGLPYFVDDIRAEVAHRLSRGRVLAVLFVALVVGAVAGVVVGTLGEASFGPPVGASVALVVVALYALRALKASVIAGWALRRAFRSLGLDRRQALWEVSALHDRPIALFEGQPSASAAEVQVTLPLMSPSEHVVQDYASTSLSLKAHPVSFVREKLRMLHIKSTTELIDVKDGEPVKVAGLVTVRQRPGTAKGICFVTIEDETGFSNLVVFEKLFEKYRKEVLQARLLMVDGKLQREGEVVHVIVKRCYDLSKLLRGLTVADKEDLPVLTLSRADEKTNPFPAENKRITLHEISQKDVYPAARDFK